jgi:DNA-binding CsgD family transcriptional regulator
MGRDHTAPTAAAARRAITALCATGMPPLELLHEVADRIGQVVPYAAAGWQLTDPATQLTTGGFAENVDAGTHLRLIENELTGGDFLAFTGVARSRVPVTTLSQATQGELDRSPRHRTINAPAGWGDELRAVFQADGTPWGQMCLARAEDQPLFTAEESAFVAAVGDQIGTGLRGAWLLDRADGAEPGNGAPGLVVLRDDGSVDAVSDDALRWLDELPEEGLELPSVVYEVARRARLLADTARPGPPARARVRLPSRRWLLVHGARLRPVGSRPPTTAVVVEPAQRRDMAPLVMQACELTSREREVAEMLVRGLPTADIAAALWLSPHTVRDHVKALYAKLGVRSRPQLTAMLYHER